MSIIRVFKFAVILLTVYSCEFEPFRIPENNIATPPETGPPIIIELTPETDTLKLAGPAIIRYYVKADPLKIYRVLFLVDDITVLQQEYNPTLPLEITLETRDYAEGLHVLSIVFFASTNSGSIADKIGAEGYAYTLNWPMVIDRTPVHNLAFISFDPVQNGVRVVWEKFNHAAFVNYTLSKFSDTYIRNVVLTVITDMNQNSFLDTTYLEGEKAMYSIGLNQPYGTYMQYSEYPKPPAIEQTGPSSVNVTWERTRNPGMLDYYSLYLENEYPVNHEKYEIHSPDTNSKRIDDISFGKINRFILKYVPRENDEYFNIDWINYSASEFMLGDSMPSHDVSRSVPGTDLLMLVKGSSIFRYDVETGLSTPVLQTPFDIPWSVNVAPSGNFFGYSSHGEFIVHNTTTLDTLFRLTSPEFPDNLLFIYTLSENNRLLASYYDGRLIAFDLETGAKIAEKQFLSGTLYAKLSPDGNFVMVRDYELPTTQLFYQIVDSVFVEIASLEEPENALGRYFTFSPDNKLYLFYRGRVEIRNALDFSMINQYSLPEGYVIAWDFEQKTLLVQQYETDDAFLIDIDQGDILLSMKITNASFINMKNGVITSGLGRRLNINTLSQKTISSALKRASQVNIPGSFENVLK